MRELKKKYQTKQTYCIIALGLMVVAILVIYSLQKHSDYPYHWYLYYMVFGATGLLAIAGALHLGEKLDIIEDFELYRQSYIFKVTEKSKEYIAIKKLQGYNLYGISRDINGKDILVKDFRQDYLISSEAKNIALWTFENNRNVFDACTNCNQYMG